MNTVQHDERSKSTKALNLSEDLLPGECALGVYWDVESDCFGFQTVNKNKPFTRRGVLSIISSVYDPLGFLCPFVLPAKLLMEDLCRIGVGWDETLPDHQLVKWKEWTNDVQQVGRFKVTRCIKPPDFNDIAACSLHHFSDASEAAYGIASYMQFIDIDGRVHCTLIMSRSRLAPMKTMTIPRLELSAASLATTIDRQLRFELEVHLDSSVFWTDSTIVLRYINNKDKRFQTYVAHRISIIHENSSPSQWRYVNTADNPADDLSRGVKIDELISRKRWLNGPKFLLKTEIDWPEQPFMMTDIADLEVKSDVKVYVADTECKSDTIMNRLLNRYSSWYSLKKSVAWILRAKAVLLATVRKNNVTFDKVLTVQELRQAELVIVKYEQQCEFGRHMKASENASRINREQCSELRKLDAFISADNILCVGGRLRKSDIPTQAKHPMIIPKESPIVKLIDRYYHELSNHSGRYTHCR